MMSPILVWTWIAAVFIGLWLYRRWRHFKLWSSQGVPGPKPHFIYGNILEMRHNAVATHGEWLKKYGSIVGYYFGSRATILTNDLEFLKRVQIKDFDKFTDRPLIIKGGIVANPTTYHAITRIGGKRWKEQRSILTPTFSSAKLKGMVPIIDDSIDDMLAEIDKESTQNKTFDIYEKFQGLTMDTIGRCAFGVQTNVQRNPKDPFLEASKKLFAEQPSKGLISLLICFPEIEPFVNPFRRALEIFREMIGTAYIKVVLDFCRHVIKQRRADPKAHRRSDLLQLMLDAQLSKDEITRISENLEISTNMNEEVKTNDESDDGRDINANGVSNGVSNGTSKRKTPIPSKRTLTEDEIVSNAFLFFEAGFETTSTLLAFVAHILVNYQDVQDKCRAEVEELLRNEGKLNYNTVTKLEYMEAVLYETMRIYPPVTRFVTRENVVDYEYKGIKIPARSSIIVPIYQLHHDPNHWTDPEKFDPSRFTRENRRSIDPVVWQPFGTGPRNCIGMRFALLEAKLALAKLLRKYRLVPGERTEIGDIAVDHKLVTMSPKHGVWVKAERIQS